MDLSTKDHLEGWNTLINKGHLETAAFGLLFNKISV